MLSMLPSLGRAREESEAVTDSVPVPSQKGAGKLQNHLRNGASRTWYLEASNTEPARTCSSMNTVNIYQPPVGHCFLMGLSCLFSDKGL